MKLLDKKELNDHLGKIGVFNHPLELLAKIEYAGGIEEFDKLLNGQTQNEYGAVLHLIKRPKGLQIKLAKDFSSKSVGLLASEIKKVIIEYKDAIIMHKDKSVIGRAVLGGVLLGPLGAVIGGMSGLKTGQKITIPDSIVLIDCRLDNDEVKIIFTCKRNNIPEAITFFKKLKIPVEEIKESLNDKNKPATSNIEKLERLAKLLKEGFLTEDEFNREKKKLLA